jgi:hypothetical protein
LALIALLLLSAVSAVIIAGSSLIRVSSASPQSSQLSAEVLQQIQKLDAEKESRTPAERKIDSQLIYATKMHRGESIAPGVEKLEVDVGADAEGRVVVDISADVDDQLLATFKSMGIAYSSVFRSTISAQGYGFA